ncbi:MAG: hypothetical protein PUE34_06335 [Clostridiaceae bacterium]|nr:hypothetical protein [Clostridiaceae bacterium]
MKSLTSMTVKNTITPRKKHVSIKIHFVGVGVMQFPNVEMLEKAKEEMISDAKRLCKNENTV